MMCKRAHPTVSKIAGNPTLNSESQDLEKSEPPDPFDPNRLRLSQEFVSSLGVKKALLTVPVRKPAKEWWIQVHPDPAYRLETAVLELKEERETYLVARELWDDLAGEISPRILFTTVNRQGVTFLWPVRLPGSDGRIETWSRSALEAAELAERNWVSVRANMSLGAYEVFEATGDLPDPKWPDEPLSRLIEIAFRDHFIQDFDHPVIRRLRGEA